MVSQINIKLKWKYKITFYISLSQSSYTLKYKNDSNLWK